MDLLIAQDCNYENTSIFTIYTFIFNIDTIRTTLHKKQDVRRVRFKSFVCVNISLNGVINNFYINMNKETKTQKKLYEIIRYSGYCVEDHYIGKDDVKGEDVIVFNADSLYKTITEIEKWHIKERKKYFNNGARRFADYVRILSNIDKKSFPGKGLSYILKRFIKENRI